MIERTRGELPRVSPLPGRSVLDRTGPATAQDKRAFFALRAAARDAHLSGNAGAAAADYARALVCWPGHTDGLYYLGHSYLELGDERAALDAFTRLVHFDVRSSGGWMQIGLIRFPGGDALLDGLDAAEEAFQHCHDLSREESRPALQLGIVQLLRDDLATTSRLPRRVF